MRLIGVIAVFCALLACYVSIVHSQTSAPVVQGASQAQPKPDILQVAKLQALQAELEIHKEFTQHILSTVYFALGTVVVVLVAMLGFGWYQHVRVAEHEKEALRKELATALSEGLARGTADIDKKLTDQILEVDRKFAGAFELTLRRLTELRLSMVADIFRATHSGKTPRTDFVFLVQVAHSSIGKADPEVLKHSLSVLTEHLETTGGVSPPVRTSLVALANELPSECSAYAESIRELLAKKSDAS